jgi:hypothetical protein
MTEGGCAGCEVLHGVGQDRDNSLIDVGTMQNTELNVENRSRDRFGVECLLDVAP